MTLDATLDGTDLEILSLLQEDAGLTNAAIGRRVGLVASAVHRRLRKLEQSGVLLGLEARVAPAALGLGLTAYIFVRTTDRVGAVDTAGRLAGLDPVQEVHHVAGEDCYLLKVRVADTGALGRFLREQVGRLDTVRSTRTTIVLETMKETAKLPIPTAGDDR